MSTVTAADCRAGGTTATRNGAGDKRSFAEWRARARELSKTAERCFGCDAELAETIWRVRAPVPVAPFKRSWRVVPTCEDCAPQWRGFGGPYPCEGGCGREVFVQAGLWYRRRVYCSSRCQGAMYAAKRTAERTALRGERPCEGCGEPFTPKRADARYCSGACRQCAYRARSARGAS